MTAALSDRPKRALITGITGQDGPYLAELLLQKATEVHGIKRRYCKCSHWIANWSAPPPNVIRKSGANSRSAPGFPSSPRTKHARR